jgi:hypothetical protein
MRNFGYFCFWSVAYVMLLEVSWIWVLWAIVSATADTEARQDCFQRLLVAFGWLASYMLVGIAGGYHQKKSSS